MDKDVEAKWPKAIAASLEAVGIIDPSLIAKEQSDFIANIRKKENDWKEAAAEVKPWKLWADVCGNNTIRIHELLKMAEYELPATIEGQAKGAVYLFPEAVMQAITTPEHSKTPPKVTLTASQNDYLFGLIHVQGQLMSQAINPRYAGLEEKTDAVLDAMSRYWLMKFDRIWRDALPIRCDNGQTLRETADARFKILEAVFDAACKRILNTIDVKQRSAAQKAIGHMKSLRFGLTDMIKQQQTFPADIQEGINILSDTVIKPNFDLRDGWSEGRCTVIKWGKKLKYQQGDKADHKVEYFNITAPKCWKDIELLMKKPGDYVKVSTTFAQNFTKGDAHEFFKIAIEAEGKAKRGTGRYRLLI